MRGHKIWSLVDDFEWEYGFSKRFGLTHTDYVTQKCVAKNSGELYADVTRKKGGLNEPSE